MNLQFSFSRRKSRAAKAKKIELRGEKTVLREKRITDAPDDYSWRTDEELAKLDAANPLKMAYDDFLKHSQEELDRPNKRSMRFGIDDLYGRHIGNCMIYDINERRGSAELGIMIGDREYWSKGYGSDTVDMLLDYLFTNTRMRRVYLHTLTWNGRAQRAFGKSGFRPVRDVRRHGYDFLLMEIYRKDWERLRGQAAALGG